MTSPRQIKNVVNGLLETYGQRVPPIDVAMVAQGEGAIVIPQRLGWDVSGVLLRDDSQTLLGVNSAHHPRRQRFTIAHEIGHLLLHPGRSYTVDSTVRLNWRDDLSSLATDKEEIAANAFAAELLMPERLIRAAIDHIATSKISDEDRILDALARRFDVSTEAMSYRLINLGIRS